MIKRLILLMTIIWAVLLSSGVAISFETYNEMLEFGGKLGDHLYNLGMSKLEGCSDDYCKRSAKEYLLKSSAAYFKKNNKADQILIKQFNVKHVSAFVDVDSIISSQGKVKYWSYGILPGYTTRKSELNDFFIMMKDYSIVDCDSRTKGKIISEIWRGNTDDSQFQKYHSENAENTIMESLEATAEEEVNFVCSYKKEIQPTTNKISQGTGFVIANNLIVTAEHVVGRLKTVHVVSTDGKKYLATPVLRDHANDIVLLKLDTKNIFVTELALASDNSRIGSKVFTIGYPHADLLGNNFKVTDGIISSLSGINDDHRMIQTSVPVQSGNSGGPLIDSNGNVIGMIISKISADKMYNLTGDLTQNVNYAIKSKYISLLIDNLGLSELRKEKKNQKKERDIDKLVDKLKTSIVMVIADGNEDPKD